MESEGITVSFYENSIPPFVEPEMDRLYENIYSSLAHHKVYGGVGDNTNTYIARKNGEAISVLLFEVEKNRVHVLNESIKIDAEEIDRFARHIFETLPDITVIFLHAIRAKFHRLAYPYQQSNVLEDIVAMLPATSDEYLASLGKSTRKNIKNHISKLKRNFPSLHHDVYVKEEVSEQHVRELVGFNRRRMAGKNKASAIDDNEVERVVKLARLRGFVSVMTIDGRVCAGNICCQVGANYFVHLIAHDPEYNEYRLGKVCTYLTICECISRGGKEFHFLWGRDEYKYQLLGAEQNLDDLAIYRSRIQMLLNGNTAMRIAFNGYVRKAKVWLRHKARQQDNPGFTSRLAFHSLNRLRSLKQFASGLIARQR